MAERDPWKTRSHEEEADDLFFEEEGDEEGEMKRKREEAQKELTNAGMLLVSGSEWKEQLRKTLIEAFKDEKKRATLADDALFERIYVKSIEKASKATCLVRRRKNSKSRLEYYEKIKDEERLKKAKKGKGGTGTGFLIFPESKFGWFVITNNHVIMDEEEAKSAEVIFEHYDDESLPGETKRFKVKQLFSKDIRTEGGKDFQSLDFSVLVLEISKGNFLGEYAGCSFDERDTNEICRNKTILGLSGLEFVPMITFSHPHGLGKRISVGKYPSKCGESVEFEKTHLRHDLPTTRGSSGANLIYFHPHSGEKFVFLEAAFLHYRHGLAVSWRAIGPALRKDFSKHESFVVQNACDT